VTVQRKSCTTRKPCPDCTLSARLETCGPPRSARPVTSEGPSCSEIEVTSIIRDFESGPGVFEDDGGGEAGHDIRHHWHVQVHSRALGYLGHGHVFRMDADRTPSLLRRCWVVDGKQPSGKSKDLSDAAVHKLLDELGLGLLDASNKSEWHNLLNLTRPEALAARAASKFPALGSCPAAQRPTPLLSPKGLHQSHPHHTQQLAPR
jgi:hypothetical protein